MYDEGDDSGQQPKQKGLYVIHSYYVSHDGQLITWLLADIRMVCM